MGSLHDFSSNCKPVKKLRIDYNCNVFVETGCFRGNSLSYALGQGFERLYSCDIDQEMIDYCNNSFKNNKNLTIYKNTSTEFLQEVLQHLKNDRILFYLDAHLPEHDKNNGEILTDSPLNFPLQKEIEIINELRPNSSDVIICDDLRIYEDGPFVGGNWSKRLEFNIPSIFDFLDKYNYNIEKFYSCEGYLLLTK